MNTDKPTFELPENPTAKDMQDMLENAFKSVKDSQSKKKSSNREIQSKVLKDVELQNKLIDEFKEYDSWLLLNEAIPLSMGIHPSHSDSIGITEYDMYKKVLKLARSSIGVSTLILNSTEKEKFWRVEPKEFSNWLIKKGFKLFPPMHEIAKPNKKKANKSLNADLEPNPRKERFAVVREQIFIAAIAVLANFREQCVGKNGEISPDSIYEIMNDKAQIWFENGELPLDDRTIIEHISKAINTAKRTNPS
jgi:hypothetical protein